MASSRTFAVSSGEPSSPLCSRKLQAMKNAFSTVQRMDMAANAARPLPFRGTDECSELARLPALLQRAADRGELLVQRRAEIVDDGDDRERDAGGDQAVFDRCGAGLVGEEAADGPHGLARIPIRELARTIIRTERVPQFGTPACVNIELIAILKPAARC